MAFRFNKPSDKAFCLDSPSDISFCAYPGDRVVSPEKLFAYLKHLEEKVKRLEGGTAAFGSRQSIYNLNNPAIPRSEENLDG
jgi:hypothetical protein